MSLISVLRLRPSSVAIALGLVGFVLPSFAASTVTYSYDQLGRLTTARYDNGICIVYTYDANGNRTSQTNALFPPTWGTGAWDCFQWTPH